MKRVAPVSLLSGILVAGLLDPGAAGQYRFAATGKTHVPPDSGLEGAALADFDGDGHLDLAMCHFLRGVALYANDGRGHFGAATWMPLPLPRWADAADVDGDGRMDLLVARDNFVWSVLFGDGRGGFMRVDLPAGGSTLRAAALGDVDRDGDLDVFLTPTAALLLLENRGGRAFVDSTSTRLPPIGLGNPVLADVDGDGAVDLLHVASGVLPRLYRNDGSGVFAVAAVQPPAPPADVAAFGDFDGDGDQDLVVAAQALSALLRNDSGAFTAVPGSLPQPVGRPTALHGADVEGDGDLDLLLPGGSATPLAVWINDGSARFVDGTAQWLAPATVATSRLAAADVDGDRDADVALAVSGLPQLLVSDTRRFRPANANRLQRVQPGYGHALADLDGDGDLDMFTSAPSVVLNDGSGLLVEQPGRVPAAPGPASGTTLGDVDGDGDVDAVVGGHLVLALYLNDGRATFTDASATHLPPQRDSVTACPLADLDADGDLDLVLPAAGQSRIYVNDGSGRFADETAARLPAANLGTVGAAVGDVDGDGDPDLVLGNRGYQYSQTRLYLNDGSGRFQDVTPTHLPAVLYSTQMVVLGDVDGDRDQDLVLLNLIAPVYVLWSNDGSGRFTAAGPSRFPPERGTVHALTLADLDGDGDRDVVAAAALTTLSAQLLWNDGTGTFRDGTPELQPAHGFVTAGDLDRDGDVDLAFDSDLRCNRERHVATPFLVVTGRTLDIDFAARPGWATEAHFALPVLATQLLPLPLAVPPWGLLFVHPVFAVTLPPVPLPAPGGEARLTLPLPDAPQLVGVVAHVQALIVEAGAPLREPRLTGYTSDVVIR